MEEEFDIATGRKVDLGRTPGTIRQVLPALGPPGPLSLLPVPVRHLRRESHA